MSGPLAGVAVLEIAEGLTVPLTGMQLSDAGAAVVKIEPLAGDYARQMGPPFVDGVSAVFQVANRGKRDIALDLEHASARSIVATLAKNVDVVVTDLEPDRCAALGIDYVTLTSINPTVILASISPFGERGPYSKYPGSELVAQAMADYAGSLGTLGEEPRRIGTDVASMNTAIFTVQAIAAALVYRQRTGQGQKVSTSLLGSLLHLRGLMWSSQTNPDEWFGVHNDTYVKPEDHGYKTKTLPVSFRLGRGDSSKWDELVTRLDMFDVLEDERFADYGRSTTGLGRLAHEVKERWEQAFADLTAEEVIEIVHSVEGDAAAFNTYDTLAADPQIKVLEMIQEVALENGETLRMAGIPWKMLRTPGKIQGPAPALGRHTDEILRDAGYAENDISDLRAASLIR